MEGDSREKCDQSHIDGVLVASVIGDAESETGRMRSIGEEEAGTTADGRGRGLPDGRTQRHMARTNPYLF